MKTQVAFTAPHSQAAEIGQRLLADGANAVDAMIAAAAAISVVYPHMNSLAGDGFWLIQHPGETPIAIDACGFSAKKATMSRYDTKGYRSIPARGGAAALCMGGTLDGWRLAREHMAELSTAKSHSFEELLLPAIALAEKGIEVTASLQAASEKVAPDFSHDASGSYDDYQRFFCPNGRPLRAGEMLHNSGMAAFLSLLAEQGTDTFYRGELAKNLTNWLEFHSSPLCLDDFQAYQARFVEPLSTEISGATLYNLPAPTQGIASLMILALNDRRASVDENKTASQQEADFVHFLVEATKRAFLVRDAEVTDSSRLSPKWSSLLSDESLDRLAKEISSEQAMQWPHRAEQGDTVWMGALDAEGCMVSFIQSIYWEFGSGLVHPEYGLVWNNRGASFSLDKADVNCLAPRVKPRHTLNPAMAVFDDGRRLTYGTMGGDGQPQTQAALFTRFAQQNHGLAEAIARPRWLLGRTWGEQTQDLKLEADLYREVGAELKSRGHRISEVPAQDELMGHAGAICLSPDGSAEAATDPRSDGGAFIGHLASDKSE